MQLSPHFSLAELTASDEAAKFGISNQPGPEHLANLRITAYGLEVVRGLLDGKPLRITSCYRSPALNARVGGTPTSAHCLGYAADIVPGHLSLAEAARRLVGFLPFDQLIYEHKRCVHISFDPRLRCQVLTQRGAAGTPFELGINQ